MIYTLDDCKRFWSKVDVPSSDECWEWVAGREANGYGSFWDKRARRMRNAHIVAYLSLVGEIPKGMCVLHRCDNRTCCNPSHLFLGTRLDNNRDRMNKGRNNSDKRRGESNGLSKLTDEEVLRIRELYATRKYSQETLGLAFGVTQAHISRIVLRQIWTHLT